jgi:CheY-like chemotaxis protein
MAPNRQIILVVEDDAIIRMDIAEGMRTCGWRVVEAGSATEAIAIFEAGVSVDLVFSDIQMPGGMDGFGLAQWVRQHRPGIPIILTSGVVQRSEAADALCDEGPIAKPYDQQRLAERIRHHLGQAGTGPA